MRKQNSVAKMMNEKRERDNEARSVGRCGERRDEGWNAEQARKMLHGSPAQIIRSTSIKKTRRRRMSADAEGQAQNRGGDPRGPDNRFGQE